MRVALIQLEVSDRPKSQSIARVRKTLADLKECDLAVLPELWNIGYFSFDRYQTEAEPLDGETVAVLADCVRKLGIYCLAGSIIESQNNKFYNTSVMFDPRGKLVATYRKIHLFSYESQEDELLTPGEQIGLVETNLGRFGIVTCYDLRFPELFRSLVKAGAECFLVIAAWPYPRLEHWLLLNRVRALENAAFLIACNCVGNNRGKQFLGHSMCVDPWGIPIAMTGDRETVVYSDIDIAYVATARREFPALLDWLKNEPLEHRKG